MKRDFCRTLVLSDTPRNLSRLANALRRGQVVAVPSETVYGLAAYALDPVACRRIFTAKRRPADDPLIVHISRLADWELLADVSPEALAVARAFWPGPLTIVLPKKPSVPAIVTSGLPSVAVRMPAHPLFRRLLERVGLPLAAPSANPFGYVSPTRAKHVLEGLDGRIPYVLDGGPCEIGVESTILDLRDSRRPSILRPGVIGAGEISRVLRREVSAYRARTVARGSAAPAPGMLARHYSPRTPLFLATRADQKTLASMRPGEVLVMPSKPRRTPRLPEGVSLRWLATEADARAEAHGLFDCIRKMDTDGFSRIVAVVPGGHSPLAEAMRDRLTRAAARRD